MAKRKRPHNTMSKKEEGQTIQCPKEEGQTIQCPKEENDGHHILTLTTSPCILSK
jgi:hypothetical protein